MAIRTKHLSANTGVYARCELVDGRIACAYLNLVNTVSTTSWPMGQCDNCLERGNSVHTGSRGSFIQLMFICFNGRDKCSLLPFQASSAVNMTTVKDEGTREFLASGYDVLQHLGFGKTGGRCGGFYNKNCNFSTVLHGVLNRERYIERLLTVRGLRFSRNAFFPPVKYSTVTDTEQVIQAQIYPSSLAINLQNLTKATASRYGPFILQQIACEADVDTSLMRFCVDAEWRMCRTLTPNEKIELVVAYYSFRWLEFTEPGFNITTAMHDFLQRGLRLFTLDHERYWYTFEREKYKNWEINNLFVENTRLHCCPHADGFRVFVKTFLTSMGHVFAAQQIRNAFPDAAESLTHKDIRDCSLARHWYQTHVLEYHCLYNV